MTPRTRALGVLGAAIALVFGFTLAASAPQSTPGRGRGLQFTEPSPIDFADHEGYVSIFDGRTLDGWDGNPRFWRVEDGAIVGESTPERPSGNSYRGHTSQRVRSRPARLQRGRGRAVPSD